MVKKENFVAALDRATKYESELLHPEKVIGKQQLGNNISVTTTTINRIRPEKKYIHIGVNDIVKNGQR